MQDKTRVMIFTTLFFNLSGSSSSMIGIGNRHENKMSTLELKFIFLFVILIYFIFIINIFKKEGEENIKPNLLGHNNGLKL